MLGIFLQDTEPFDRLTVLRMVLSEVEARSRSTREPLRWLNYSEHVEGCLCNQKTKTSQQQF